MNFFHTSGIQGMKLNFNIQGMPVYKKLAHQT